MNEYELRISEAAEKDVEEIADYISLTLQEPVAAKKQITRIKDAVVSLSFMPERHSLVSEEYLASRGIRKILIDKYLIFYTVDNAKQIVNIVRVLYGRREWESLL